MNFNFNVLLLNRKFDSCHWVTIAGRMSTRPTCSTESKSGTRQFIDHKLSFFNKLTSAGLTSDGGRFTIAAFFLVHAAPKTLHEPRRKCDNRKPSPVTRQDD